MDELKKLEEILKKIEAYETLGGDVPTTKEVARAFEMLLEAVALLKKTLEKQIDEADEEMKREITEKVSEMEERMAKAHSATMKAHSQEMLQMKEKMTVEMESIKELIPQIPDLSPLEKKLEDIKKEIPKVPENLATLEAIEVLKDELKKEIDEVRKLPRGGGASRRVFQPQRDNFTSQTDGATKTFYLTRAPLSDVVFVYGTDFPRIYNPATDFTIANKTLTLTSAVPAPSSGATLLVEYFS